MIRSEVSTSDPPGSTFDLALPFRPADGRRILTARFDQQRLSIGRQSYWAMLEFTEIELRSQSPKTGRRNRMRGLLFSVIVVYGLIASSIGMEPVRIEASRDAWISAYPSEQEGNNGAAHRLKLKGIQEFFLIDFDCSAYRGKHVQRAELWLRSEGGDHADRVTVSSVGVHWNEGKGTNYEKGTDGCTFRRPNSDADGWGGAGQDVTSVTLGNGGSVWSFGDSSPPDRDGWQRIPIAPEVMQRQLDGNSFGFLVMDDLGSEYRRDGNRFEYRLMPGRFFASREKNRSSVPYLLLWLSESDPSPFRNEGGRELEKPRAKPFPTPEWTRILARVRGEAYPTEKELNENKLLRLDGTPEVRKSVGISRGETLTWIIDCQPDEFDIEPHANLEVDVFALPTIDGKYDPALPKAAWSKGISPEGQKNEATRICIDVYAKKTATAGPAILKFRVRGEQHEIRLEIWGFTLPDRLSFIPQMNCYGIPNHEIEYYLLCHNHRTTLNCLRYAWTGRVAEGSVPKVTSDGGWDWSAWRERFGPLFDGRAFENSRRGPIPVEAFYLPLNENWPMDHERHFRGGYWIENAYDDSYWNEFRQAVSAFADQLETLGYNQTVFEFYMNNKVYFKQDRGGKWDACSASWIFDEPVNTQDFWALRRFGMEFWSAIGHRPNMKFAFRVDISRPEWQRDLLDGVSNVEVVSGSLRSYEHRVMTRAKQYENWIYMYGSANDFQQSIVSNVAWCVETWLRGGAGVVPWQTVGTKDSWNRLDPLSVIYPTDQGPVASLRLKSFREGEQLIEYLAAFEQLSGIGRDAMRNDLFKVLSLEGSTIKSSEIDAGSVQYESLSFEPLDRLREAIGAYLHENSKRNLGTFALPSLRQGSSKAPMISPWKLSEGE